MIYIQGVSELEFKWMFNNGLQVCCQLEEIHHNELQLPWPYQL